MQLNARKKPNLIEFQASLQNKYYPKVKMNHNFSKEDARPRAFIYNSPFCHNTSSKYSLRKSFATVSSFPDPK